MKKLFVLIIAALGCSPAIAVENVGSNGITTATQTESQIVKKTIDWQTFDDDLIKTSLALNKPIFLYLKDANCEFCNKMDNSTFNNEIVIDLINKKLLATSVDIEEEPEIAATFYKDDNIVVPKFVFIRQIKNNQQITVGAVGYRDPFQIIELIDIAETFVKNELKKYNQHEEGAGKH